MGLFNKKEKKIIAEISKKNKIYHQDIEKEITDLRDDLEHDFEENKIILEEFSIFIEELKSKISKEEFEKLNTYFQQVSKMKNCAKKGIESLNNLAKEQRKLSKDSLREYEEYLN
ncbi:hypothetical protein ABGT15_11890 [Flavobacterium enshiense]|uniref:hypothetical protein n=1 Tax=Flavobacterium enshiense TaxID=1341165 RepID=UPI00345D06BF